MITKKECPKNETLYIITLEQNQKTYINIPPQTLIVCPVT